METNEILFVDGNYSENMVYKGTKDHMEGLRNNGGCVCIVSENYAQKPGRTIRKAPEHWATEK